MSTSHTCDVRRAGAAEDNGSTMTAPRLSERDQTVRIGTLSNQASQLPMPGGRPNDGPTYHG
jgi:hypothetical protein